MAHNIYGNRVALHSEPAWHQLGTVFAGSRTLKEVLALSGCDFSITLEDIPNLVVNGLEVDMSDRVAIVRHANGSDKTPVMLEVVSKDYKLVTNQELVNIYNSLSETYPVETMGALGKGETFFFTLDIGEVEVNGEAVHRFLLVTDNKTGLQKTKAAYTPVRVVCQNTLYTGLRQADVRMDVAHRTGNLERLKDIARIIQNIKSTADTIDQLFGLMGKTPISLEDFKKALAETIYPNKDDDEPMEVVLPGNRFLKPSAMAMSKENKDQMACVELFNKYNDTMPTQYQGTTWAAWQAVTDNEDWKQGRGEGQYVSALFGQRANVKATAFNVFSKMVVK
jgi:phage/plasmid-like protein (TIGR03299 family)